ncbi:MAG TPA: hypothetical protein VMF08_06030 [Candidatus Sulfotelmatobacter sp.]|nr:hypothetical protein [Candidatus Sulfotelmatobacter sp.]
MHKGTYFVQETTSNGETVWEGDVEAFSLSGQSRTCYAWQHADNTGRLKIFAVLENQFIDSPSKAVQAALFTDAQPPVHPFSNSFETLKRLLVECKDRIRKIAMTVENLDATIETVRQTRELIAQKRQPSA